jgi:hypothetical protein
MEIVKDLNTALGADTEEGLTETLYVSASEVKLGDLLLGYWVTGITLGQHDGRKAFTFQLGSPLTPNGEVTRGRLTLIDSKDDGVIVVREVVQS